MCSFLKIIVLSDKDLRKKYNQFGKDQAVPEAGFEDPSELISTIFGGEAFHDLYVFTPFLLFFH